MALFPRLPEFQSWRKPDHYAAAIASAYAASETNRSYLQAVRAALETYGDGSGVLISSVVRDHFPERVKDQLRVLARYAGLMSDASHAHWRASGRRRETWTRMREAVKGS